MVQRLPINHQVLSSYVRQSNTSMEVLRKRLPKIEDYLSGEQQPTFNQLSTLAQVINVPTGLLLLDEPVDTTNNNLNFRTLNSHQVDEMSSELRDTILEMQEKQDFLREEVDNDCEFVGKFSFDDDINTVIESIKSYLAMGLVKDRFKSYRERIGELGVFVFLNGHIKDNTHRGLDLSEFRGFVLADKRAPLIFINQKDSNTGRLFTLIHEFVHLFYGESELMELAEEQKHSREEAIINRITAEILLPKDELLKQYDESLDIHETISKLARKYEVSPFVVIRRLFDVKLISQSDYQQLDAELKQELDDILKVREKSGRANYNTNLRYRIDNHFFKYVTNAISQNRMTYTDAFELVGVGYKGFKILSEGGV